MPEMMLRRMTLPERVTSMEECTRSQKRRVSAQKTIK